MQFGPLLLRPRLVPLCTLLILSGLAGCSGAPDAPQLVAVSGVVTVDGEPVEQGTIAFVSANGGRTAVTQIVNGKYSLSRSEGPLPGNQKVTIQAYRKTGKVLQITKTLPRAPDEAHLPTQTEVEETEQILPERYNAKSILRAVLPERDNRDVDYELTTAPESE